MYSITHTIDKIFYTTLLHTIAPMSKMTLILYYIPKCSYYIKNKQPINMSRLYLANDDKTGNQESPEAASHSTTVTRYHSPQFVSFIVFMFRCSPDLNCFEIQSPVTSVPRKRDELCLSFEFLAIAPK